MRHFDYRVLGRLKKGQMNRTEAAYAQHLELLKHSGEILWYAFDSIKLRLAGATFYSPDFMLVLKSGELEMHEVKGFMLDDANVKIKVAASLFPFVFKLIRKVKGGAWDIQEV